MEKSDIRKLLQQAVTSGPQAWADFGSGAGAFTLALRELAGPDASLVAIDKNADALKQLENRFRADFPDSPLRILARDFSGELELPPLDGILMANSLHYIWNKKDFLTRCAKYLKPGGRILIVEYNTNWGNPWVPFPISFPKLQKLVSEIEPYYPARLLDTVPARYQREMYSALIQLK